MHYLKGFEWALVCTNDVLCETDCLAVSQVSCELVLCRRLRDVKGIKGSRIDVNLATKQDGGKNVLLSFVR
jgi:hypothetical protein